MMEKCDQTLQRNLGNNYKDFSNEIKWMMIYVVLLLSPAPSQLEFVCGIMGDIRFWLSPMLIGDQMTFSFHQGCNRCFKDIIEGLNYMSWLLQLGHGDLTRKLLLSCISPEI